MWIHTPIAKAALITRINYQDGVYRASSPLARGFPENAWTDEFLINATTIRMMTGCPPLSP